MRPCYELLELPADSGGGDAGARSDQAALRRLARAHPGALLSPHVSRSYCGSLALVAWHDAPLGVDLELITPGDREFAASICTPEELRRYGERLGEPAFVTSLWASKEALAKALGDALAYDPRRLPSPLGWDGAASGRWRAAQLQPAPGHVGWIVWSEGPQNSAASAASADSTRLAAGRR